MTEDEKRRVLGAGICFLLIAIAMLLVRYA